MVMAFANDVSKASLDGELSRRQLVRSALAGLALMFHGQASGGSTTDATTNDGPRTGNWVCTDADCEPYIYHPIRADPENMADPAYPFPPGTGFETLPKTWRCPFCGNPKSPFARYFGV